MTVEGERLWYELRGESCLSLETVQPDKKQICTSRSFGQPITELADMSAAVAGYAGQCAYKLRGQKSAAVSLMVFVTTNFFKKEQPQYYNSKVVKLPVPTSSTIEIVKFARLGIEQIFRTGYQYKKAGVIITEIIDAGNVQGNIFYQMNTPKHDRLMTVIDKINNSHGRDKVRIAAAGAGKYEMRRNMLSPNYTTSLKDVFHVKV
jgi:DNA polymerase V